MTKQEYEKKYDECNNWLGNIRVCRKYISSLEAVNDKLKAEIAQLQADNRSLVEQMNAMAMKPNQEVVTWHSYPEERPERPTGTLIPNPVNQLFLLVKYQTIDGNIYVCLDDYYWVEDGAHGFGIEIDVTVLAWAYLPKGVNND